MGIFLNLGNTRMKKPEMNFQSFLQLSKSLIVQKNNECYIVYHIIQIIKYFIQLC